jgi:hypothetical protein
LHQLTGSFAAGIAAVACGSKKLIKANTERATNGSSFADCAFIVFW